MGLSECLSDAHQDVEDAFPHERGAHHDAPIDSDDCPAQAGCSCCEDRAKRHTERVGICATQDSATLRVRRVLALSRVHSPALQGVPLKARRGERTSCCTYCHRTRTCSIRILAARGAKPKGIRAVRVRNLVCKDVQAARRIGFLVVNARMTTVFAGPRSDAARSSPCPLSALSSRAPLPVHPLSAL